MNAYPPVMAACVTVDPREPALLVVAIMEHLDNQLAARLAAGRLNIGPDEGGDRLQRRFGIE